MTSAGSAHGHVCHERQVRMMPRMLIRLSGDVPASALEAFPALACVTQPAHTALVGPIADQEELQGIVHHLNDLGIAIVEVVTIPDDTETER